jgi:hypothetical protein
MGFSAPTTEQPISPERWAHERELAAQGSGYNADLSEQIAQLPSFQAWVDSMQAPGFHGSGVGNSGAGRGSMTAWKALMSDMDRAGIQVPEDEMVDGYTGTVRDKSWMERHPVLGAVLVGAAVAGGGVGAAAMLGGGGAAAGAAGASALGPTSAGSMAATTAALGGSTVPAALGGAGLMPAIAGGAAAAGGAAGAAGLGPTTAGSMAATESALAGGTVPASLGGAGAMPAVGGTASTLTAAGKLAKAANSARGVGNAISNASSAAGEGRRTDARIGQDAQSVYERSLMQRAALEDAQRKDALKDVYRSSFFKNEQTGPYSAKPQSALSPEYLQGLSDLERQGAARLGVSPEYDSTKLKKLEEKEVAPAGTLEKVGSYVGPALSTAGTVAQIYGSF